MDEGSRLQASLTGLIQVRQSSAESAGLLAVAAPRQEGEGRIAPNGGTAQIDENTTRLGAVQLTRPADSSNV